MYNDDVLETPRNNEHFWEMVEENFEYAHHVLWDIPVQTRDEALQGKRVAMRQIGFRDVSEEMDQRDHYHRMGRALLPVVKQLIDDGIISAVFCQQWGKLMFCHGLVAAYVFDDADDMSSQRGAQNSAVARSSGRHRVWLAHIFALPQFAGLKRETADYEVGEYLHTSREEEERNYPDAKEWFDKILSPTAKDGETRLRSVFQRNNLSSKKMKELQQKSRKDLPPLPYEKS